MALVFDKNQPHNKLALLPPPLEVETKRILKQAIQSGRALAELKLAGRLIPNQSLMINSLVLLEAKDSSEIENIFTTHDKLFQADMLDEVSVDSQTKEVKRYREALWKGAKLAKKRSLSTNVFIEIVQTIKESNLSVRTTPGTQIVNPFGEVIYTPPEGESLLRDLLQNLEDFIHNNEDYDPLIKMAIIHYQFEAIHPFTDGNGRAGRIINILYLLLEELLETPVLFLSSYIIENKTQYYKGLQNVTENQDWENWIFYMLKAVEVTANDTVKHIHNILALMEYTKQKMQDSLPKIYSKELLEILFEHPYCRIQTLSERLNLSRQTASKYLKSLSDEGVLVEDKIGSELIFFNHNLIALLSDTNLEENA